MFFFFFSQTSFHLPPSLLSTPLFSLICPTPTKVADPRTLSLWHIGPPLSHTHSHWYTWAFYPLSHSLSLTHCFSLKANYLRKTILRTLHAHARSQKRTVRSLLSTGHSPSPTILNSFSEIPFFCPCFDNKSIWIQKHSGKGESWSSETRKSLTGKKSNVRKKLFSKLDLSNGGLEASLIAKWSGVMAIGDWPSWNLTSIDAK